MTGGRCAELLEALGGHGAARPLRRVGMPMRGRARGFSLLEVLVALAVLALALFALSRSAALAVDAMQHREQVLLASTVAANVVTELRLAESTPATGQREGQQSQGGREFYWRATISDSDVPGIRRIDVAVALDPARSDVRVRLAGFAGRP